jgi:ssDNA-binding Zn-finger/Zn-ribbon topoisomerase 1
MSTEVDLQRQVTPMCPQCGGRMHLIDGKHGQFWGCNGYPECSGSISTRSNGRTGSSRRIQRWSDHTELSAYEEGGEAEEAFRDSYFGGDEWSIFDSPG